MRLRDNAHRRQSDDTAERAMGFLEHLDELRSRLIRSCIAIAAGMVSALPLAHVVLREPAMKVGFRVEDTFTQYKNMLLAMIVVFQLPTIVFFLARLGVVTARFLCHRIQYAILIIFIAAAVLTPAPDSWNQTVLAAPMLVMYLISIVIAWAAAPRGRKSSAASNQLRLVVAASVLDQARRKR